MDNNKKTTVKLSTFQTLNLTCINIETLKLTCIRVN